LWQLLPGSAERAEEVLRRLSGRYAITLRFSDTGQRATTSFDGGCSLTQEEELASDRCQAVRLPFGPDKSSSSIQMGRRMASYLDLIFPLPFYHWEADMR